MEDIRLLIHLILGPLTSGATSGTSLLLAAPDDSLPVEEFPTSGKSSLKFDTS